MAPQPCLAVILLFPSNKKVFILIMNFLRLLNYEKTSNPANYENSNLFYIKQIPELGNACGTIALLHSFANNISSLAFSLILFFF